MRLRPTPKTVLAMIAGVSLLLVAPSYAGSSVINSAPGSTANSQVTMEATVPSNVYVNVFDKTHGSTLDVAVLPGSIGTGVLAAGQGSFSINGNVYSNDVAGVNITLSGAVTNKVLTLTGPNSSTINVNLSGTIGGTAIANAGTSFQPTFTTGAAPIALTGTLDPTSLPNNIAPGAYDGTLVITAVAL